MGSGSEVGIVVAAQQILEGEGLPTRVVSMPCMEAFAAQPEAYRQSVLPPGVRARVAVEAAHPMPWYRWTGDGGDIAGLDHFGASAPYERLYEEFGLTPTAVAARARTVASRA